MARRGFTLVEILISLVILGGVSTMVMNVLLYQNRNWKTESERAQVAMMVKGTLDELTRAARMTGAGLPDGSAGIKVWGSGEERVTFVMNQARWVDTTAGYTYDPTDTLLRIAIDSAKNFSDKGYVRLNLYLPPAGSHAPSASSQIKTFTLGIKDRVTTSGGCGDSLLLDAAPLLASPNLWNQAGDVQVWNKTLVYSFDSVGYRKSNDTLYTKLNRQPETVYATGVDTLRLKYWHPVSGWGDSLSGVAPANCIQKVWIRLVLRTSTVDSKLLSQNPASRGYKFATMETEVALRNDSLSNQ